jgi:hypothetical protein
MWATIEPRGQTLNVDCSSYREVLQTRFWQAPVATLTQAKGADALREGPFNAGSFIVLAFPLSWALLLPYRFQRLLLALWA